MEELFNLDISDNTLRGMIELNPELLNITNKEVLERIEILKKLGCSEIQIRNIISSNSLYLTKTLEEIIKLINYLKHIGFTSINILLDSNPYILNLEPFEIERYINNLVKEGRNMDDIIDELDSNPYLFQEI